MRSSNALVAAAALLWAGAGCARDLQSSDVYSPDHPTVRATAYFGELIEQRTAGRHGITSLGEDNKNSEVFTIAALRNGTLDMARVNLASLSNLVPAAIVPALPYTFQSTAHMRRVLDGPVGNELLAALDRLDLVGLCFYDTGARSFYGARPIRKVSDLAGVKVRVPASGPWVAIYQAMGIQAMPMPFERVHLGLRHGTVELAENILRTAAQESVDYIRKLWDENELTAPNVAATLKIEIVSDVDRESFATAVAPVRDRQIVNPRAQEMIKRIAATP